VLHEPGLLLIERLFVGEGEERNGKGGLCGDRSLQSCVCLADAVALLLDVSFRHQCLIRLSDCLTVFDEEVLLERLLFLL
jgi:hypothetical protein